MGLCLSASESVCVFLPVWVCVCVSLCVFVYVYSIQYVSAWVSGQRTLALMSERVTGKLCRRSSYTEYVFLFELSHANIKQTCVLCAFSMEASDAKLNTQASNLRDVQENNTQGPSRLPPPLRTVNGSHVVRELVFSAHFI